MATTLTELAHRAIEAAIEKKDFEVTPEEMTLLRLAMGDEWDRAVLGAVRERDDVEPSREGGPFPNNLMRSTAGHPLDSVKVVVKR